MLYRISAILCLSLFWTQISTANVNQDLASSVGALSKYLQEKTEPQSFEEKEPALTPAAEAKYKELENDLEQCITQEIASPRIVEIQKDGASSQFKTFEVLISGPNCPIEMKAGVKANEEKQDRIQADILISILFKTAPMIEKYKFKSGVVTGKISAHIESQNNKVKMPTLVNIESKMELPDGTKVDQGMGISALVNINMAAFEFGLKIEESGYQSINGKRDDFLGLTEMIGFGQFSKDYKINNKAVSESEYRNFIQSFFVLGSVEEEDPQAPDSKVPSTCTSVVYDKNTISLQLLKDQLKSKKLQTQGQLSLTNTCNRNTQSSFNFQNQSHQSSVQFTQNWIAHDLNSNQKSVGSVFVIYGDSEPMVVENGNFLMGLQCVPTTCP